MMYSLDYNKLRKVLTNSSIGVVGFGGECPVTVTQCERESYCER